MSPCSALVSHHFLHGVMSNPDLILLTPAASILLQSETNWEAEERYLHAETAMNMLYWSSLIYDYKEVLRLMSKS